MKADGKKIYRLEPWQEAVGKLEELKVDGEKLRVVFGFGVLEFKKGTGHAEFLEKELEGWEGDVVGILRTDIPESPLLVRNEESREESQSDRPELPKWAKILFELQEKVRKEEEEKWKKEQLKYKPDPVEKANGELVWDVPYGNGGFFFSEQDNAMLFCLLLEIRDELKKISKKEESEDE